MLLLLAAPQLHDLLGNPPRVYPWGENRQPRAVPLCDFSAGGGSPEAQLAGASKVDEGTLQVDVWAKTAQYARAVRTALRDVLEPKCRITSWRAEGKDPVTAATAVALTAACCLVRPRKFPSAAQQQSPYNPP